MSTTDPETIAIEANTIRSLRQHLMVERAQVQTIGLMILAGFYGNCLPDGYREATDARGLFRCRNEARHATGFAHWKAAHRSEATAQPPSAFAAAQRLPPRWT